MADEARIPRGSALLEELRDHPHRGGLGALALEILGRQAEGRTQFVGREVVEKRAAELGLARSDAATSLANVLDVLERGASNERERALVASLAVLGLEDAIEQASEQASEQAPEQVSELVQRAIRHGAWLSVATDVDWLRALSIEATGALAPLVAAELAQQALDVATGRERASEKSRALAAALITALARSEAPEAHAALLELQRHEALDPVAAAALRALSRGEVGAHGANAPEVLEGPRAPSPARGVWAVLRWITGWALLVGLARALGGLAGRTARIRLELVDGRLDVHEKSATLGATTREEKSSVALSAIRSVSGNPRHRGVSLHAGALALALGVLIGGFWAFDGVRGGEYALVAVGVSLAALGVLADLAATALAHRARPAELELLLADGRALRLTARWEDVERWLTLLGQRIG